MTYLWWVENPDFLEFLIHLPPLHISVTLTHSPLPPHTFPFSLSLSYNPSYSLMSNDKSSVVVVMDTFS